MRLVFWGTPSFAIPSLEKILESNHQLLGVVTQPDRPKGRHLALGVSPVKVFAQERGIPNWQTEKIDDLRFIQELSHLRPDLFIVISYGKILPKELLAVPRLYSLNVHASLLPRYRGAAPIPAVILNREKETGVTIMKMSERLDAGEILLQKSTPLGAGEDAITLTEKLSRMGAELLIEALGLVESGKARFFPQDEARATYARRLTKEDGKMDWTRSAEELAAQVRALIPWPTSYTFYKGNRLVVWQAVIEKRPAYGRVGQVLKVRESEGISVSTGNEVLILKEVQVESRDRMLAIEFTRGYRVRPGDLLG